jgi:hypothetical protein
VGTPLAVAAETYPWAVGYVKFQPSYATEFMTSLPLVGFAMLVGWLPWTGRRRGRTLGPWVFVLGSISGAAFLGYNIQTRPGFLSEVNIVGNAVLMVLRVIMIVVMHLYLHGRRATEFLVR